MKSKRIYRKLKIIGYDHENNKPIYEHRTTCNYCGKQFQKPNNRAYHEYHTCPSNPQATPIVQSTITIPPNPTTLIQTTTYKITTKKVSTILRKLITNLHYEIYDQQNNTTIPLRQALRWLRNQSPNTTIYLLTIISEKAKILSTRNR